MTSAASRRPRSSGSDPGTEREKTGSGDGCVELGEARALQACGVIPNAELAVIPDATHFLPFDRPWKLEPILVEFFSAPAERLPFGTIATGYQPGRTR